MINRLFPYPAISAAVFFLWLLLAQSLSPGHLLLALVLAFLGPRPLRKLDVPRGMLRRPLAAVSLILDVVTDIIRSNIAVARIILSPSTGKVTSGMMQIPLDTRSPHALTTLACIITATPGTLWVDFDHVDGVLTIHVLDLVDEEAWIDVMKNRYERRLREIFE